MPLELNSSQSLSDIDLTNNLHLVINLLKSASVWKSLSDGAGFLSKSSTEDKNICPPQTRSEQCYYKNYLKFNKMHQNGIN